MEDQYNEYDGKEITAGPQDVQSKSSEWIDNIFQQFTFSSHIPSKPVFNHSKKYNIL